MRVAVVLAITCCGTLAWAQRPPIGVTAPTTRKVGYSGYEKETIASALKARRAALDPEPDGKTVESIEVIRLEVIDRESEPLLKIPGARTVAKLANQLHATTKEWIVRRELLLAVGDRFQQTLLDETARNLRRLRQLSLVLGVTLEGSAPDKVRILIITKDIWSLRLSYDLSLGPGGLESLVIQPSEINVAGLQHVASTQFTLQPKSYALGAGYSIPRFGTSYVGAAVSTSIIVNRDRGAPEGSTGAIAITRPLYTTLVPWSWGVSGSWTTNVIRRYVNAHLANYDATDTAAKDDIPFEYKNRRLITDASVTRSFGWANKTDLSLGYEYNRRLYRTFDRPGQSAVALEQFRHEIVPTSDTRSGAIAQLHVYTTNFQRLTDVETLALQEDYRIGHEIYVTLYPVTKAFGSSRDFVGSLMSAQYTFPIADGITRVGVETVTEGTPDKLTDAAVQGSLRVVTPRFRIGRLVLDLQALDRYRNYLNQQSYLGGDTRLRGFPSNFLLGKDVLVGNLELRSRPLSLFSLQWGGVLFYDAGDAAAAWNKLSPKQSTGVGLRVLIPQLNRVVFRADVGFPLIRPLPTGVSAASFFISFEQAFTFGSLGPT